MLGGGGGLNTGEAAWDRKLMDMSRDTHQEDIDVEI